MYKQLGFNKTPSSDKGKMRTFNNNDNDNIANCGRKEISFSEPLPSSRVRKPRINVDFPAAYSGKRNVNQRVTNLYNDNENLRKYLRQCEEIDNVHSHSLPALRSCAESDPTWKTELHKCCTLSMPKEGFYDTCLKTKTTNIISGDNSSVSSNSYLHCKLGYPLNHATDDIIPSPKTHRFAQNQPLQPSTSKFIECPRCLSESAWNDNNRGMSVETSSALSSETDSEFTFYRCSRQYHHSNGTGPTDYTNSICQLPSQLEDPDSPCPAYGQGILGNSLEDISRQFYLEDDALSDDVFVDDYTMNRVENSVTTIRNEPQAMVVYKDTPYDMGINYQMGNMTINDTPNVSSSTLKINLNEYFQQDIPKRGVAVERREERSHSVTLVVKNEAKTNIMKPIPDNRMGIIHCDFKVNDSTQSPKPLERKKTSESEFEDFELSEYNLNLANAFDSLRRNSMQTKSRKLWKERRTRMRRSTLFNLTTTVFPDVKKEISNDNENNRSTSGSLSCDYRNKSKQNIDSKSECNAKPLRGILKNKYTVYPNLSGTHSTTHSSSICQDNILECNDNDMISSHRINYFHSEMEGDSNRQPSLKKLSQNRVYNDNLHGRPSLDSASKPNRKILTKTSKVVSSFPTDGKHDELVIDGHSSKFVSIGVQVNLPEYTYLK